MEGWGFRACLGILAPTGPPQLPNYLHAHSKPCRKLYQSRIFISPIFTSMSEQSWMRNTVKEKSQAEGVDPFKEWPASISP